MPVPITLRARYALQYVQHPLRTWNASAGALNALTKNACVKIRTIRLFFGGGGSLHVLYDLIDIYTVYCVSLCFWNMFSFKYTSNIWIVCFFFPSNTSTPDLLIMLIYSRLIQFLRRTCEFDICIAIASSEMFSSFFITQIPGFYRVP